MRVKAPIPRKQGLKLIKVNLSRTDWKCESAHSKKTRIETKISLAFLPYHWKWKRPFQENKDWNRKWSMKRPSQDWVKAPIPRKQGLKLTAYFHFSQSFFGVKAPIPRKQGLKHIINNFFFISFNKVKAPIPRKQGLKLYSSMHFNFFVF